jgi:hypothetical protein
MEEIERDAIRDEGYDPDAPSVVAALDRVREALLGMARRPTPAADLRTGPVCTTAPAALHWL